MGDNWIKSDSLLIWTLRFQQDKAARYQWIVNQKNRSAIKLLSSSSSSSEKKYNHFQEEISSFSIPLDLIGNWNKTLCDVRGMEGIMKKTLDWIF